MKNSGHNTATLIAYLPRERILMLRRRVQIHQSGDDPRDPTRTPEYGLQLIEAVKALKLSPTRIAPVHGRVVQLENY